MDKNEDIKKIKFQSLGQIGGFSRCKQIQRKPVSYYEEKQKRLVKEMDEIYKEYTHKRIELEHSISELYVSRYLEFLSFCLEQGFDLNKVHEWVPQKDKYSTRREMIDELEEYLNKKD